VSPDRYREGGLFDTSARIPIHCLGAGCDLLVQYLDTIRE